jgi:transposase
MAGMLYVGMDLGKRFHQVAVVDERKESVGTPFRVKRGSRGIEKLLKQARLYGADPEDLVVTIEATASFWNELVWALTMRGCRVYLAQPKKAHDLRKFYADHTKTDITDAEAIARMPLVDEKLRPVWVPSPNEQMLLRLCRLRWKYRCRIADLKRRISTLSEMIVPGIDRVMPVRYSKSARLFLRRYLAPKKARRLGKRRLVEILSKAAWGKFSEQKAEQLWECIENAPELGWQAEDLLLEVSVQLDELEMLERQVERLDQRIAELYSEIDPEQRLMQIPGLGEFLAAALTAHIGDISRFPSKKCLVSYAGLAPRVVPNQDRRSPRREAPSCALGRIWEPPAPASTIPSSTPTTIASETAASITTSPSAQQQPDYSNECMMSFHREVSIKWRAPTKRYVRDRIPDLSSGRKALRQ